MDKSTRKFTDNIILMLQEVFSKFTLGSRPSTDIAYIRRGWARKDTRTTSGRVKISPTERMYDKKKVRKIVENIALLRERESNRKSGAGRVTGREEQEE